MMGLTVILTLILGFLCLGILLALIILALVLVSRERK